METSLHITPIVGNIIIPLKNGYNLKTISCRATNMAIQRVRAKTNFYEILSLESKNVGFEEIKRAYRAMVRRYHPDVCPPSAKEEATKRFVELTMAYETLSDPILRTNYDYELGLVDQLGFCDDIKRIVCDRDVWERQLEGLTKRSGDRMRRKTNR